ncbi:MAG: hypothetical protein AAB483_00645 [Patescibacteria group bacterium]
MGEKRPEENIIKERFDHETHQPRQVVEDAAFRARLAELREFSNHINRKLQGKLEAAGLPYYSWNRGTGPKIMRLAVLLRPPLYHSASEVDQSDRYGTSDEQMTFFLHITDDDKLQKLRFHSGISISKNRESFVSSFATDTPGHEIEKSLLERAIQSRDADGIIDYFINRLRPDGGDREAWSYAQDFTDYCQKAYRLSSVMDVRQFFANDYYILHQSKEIIRNLIIVILTTQLSLLARDLVNEKKPFEDLKNILKDRAQKILEVKIKRPSSIRGLQTFIVNSQERTSEIIRRIVMKIDTAALRPK